MENNRNYFVAIALSVLILIAWQFFYVSPKMEKGPHCRGNRRSRRNRPSNSQALSRLHLDKRCPACDPERQRKPRSGNGKSARVAIERRRFPVHQPDRRTLRRPEAQGLPRNRRPEEPGHHALQPGGDRRRLFHGNRLYRIGRDRIGSGPQTTWTLSGGDKLTPSTPVTLSYTNDKGITFSRTISVDDRYMFQVVDSIKNETAAPVSLSSYGRVTRFNKPTTPSIYVLHEGFVGVAGEHGLQEVGYSKVEDDEPVEPGKSTGGWLGHHHKYWAATIVAAAGDALRHPVLRFRRRGAPVTRATTESDA